jgi:hypothetical protein
MTKISLEVVNFKKELERVEKEVKKFANDDIEGRINFATQTLKIVTPVDTGKARSGWENKTSKDIDGYVDGEIANDVEYISILNKGHSKQAPKYFIEQTLSKIGIITPN